MSKYNREYAIAYRNSARAKMNRRAWLEKNKEILSQKSKEYRNKNLQACRNRVRKWAAENRQKINKRAVERYWETRDARLAYTRRPEIRARVRERYKLNRVRTKAKQEEFRKKVRIETFAAYGNSCRCCGESQKEFLSIDHINGRKSCGHSHKITGGRLYQWLRKRKYPQDEFQLLCYNCNFAKGIYGICPHVNAKNAK